MLDRRFIFTVENIISLEFLFADTSNITLFSGSTGRNSVDTWFEIDLPFQIEPVKECLKPNETKVFKVTFAPLEAFDFKVRLKSVIGEINLVYYKVKNSGSV